MSNLSDKKISILGNILYPVKDVKEFIKELKEEVDKWMNGMEYELFIQEIDKLAGKELI